MGLIWVSFEKTDVGLKNNTQKLENPSVAQVNVHGTESLNADDFQELTLDSRFEYYVKAGGGLLFFQT